MNNRVPPHAAYPMNGSPEDFERSGMPYGGGPSPPEYHAGRPWDGYYSGPSSAQPSTNLGQQRVQMWQNNFITDSGVQTGSQSRATSMMSMSSLHARSHMSATSTVPSELQPELNEEQEMKFQNISRSQHLEALEQLIPLMADEDAVVAERAAHMVQHIAKKDADATNFHQQPMVNRQVVESLRDIIIKNKRGNEKIVRIACCTLFHISTRQRGLQLVAQGIPNAADFFADLITHSWSSKDTSLFKYTLMTLHTIISDRTFDTRTLQLEKRMAVLQTITAWLDMDTHINEKALAIVVETMKHFLKGNEPMKRHFVDLDGLKKLMRIISRSTYVSLLQTAVLILKSIAQKDAERVVEAGAFSVLPKHLSHSSQPLVIATLECIRSISDVKAENTGDILYNTMRLLGSNDRRVELLCAGILSNMVANNKQNKELLMEKNAMGAILSALHAASYAESSSQVEEIQERLLATIQNLCSGHRHDKRVHEALVHPDMINLMLHKLSQMRPAILKQVLLIMNKMLVHPDNVRFFVYAHLNGPYGKLFYVQQICHILKTACNQISNVKVEDVKVVDLISLPLSVLHHLSSDRNLLSSITAALLHPENMQVNNTTAFLPLYLCFSTEEKVQREALGLISSLARHPEICQMLQANPNFCHFLRDHAAGRVPSLAGHAQTTLHLLEQGGGMQGAYNGYGSQPHGYSTPPTRVGYPPVQHPQTAPPPPYGHQQYPEHHVPPPYGYPPQHAPPPQDYDPAYRNPQYQEDMSNLSINDDPFVNVFCPETDAYGYPNASGYDKPPHVMAHQMPSDYGSPECSSERMGTPEPDSSWLPP
uniref:Armadillo segment polarity protein n=1 Tax=Steinernema glaseri TaxID=37863 RepID=A0A1I7Z5K6_9BILA